MSRVVQDQLQQKIVCPGVVTCLTSSPDGLFLAAGVAEVIYLWEVSELRLCFFICGFIYLFTFIALCPMKYLNTELMA